MLDIITGSLRICDKHLFPATLLLSTVVGMSSLALQPTGRVDWSLMGGCLLNGYSHSPSKLNRRASDTHFFIICLGPGRVGLQSHGRSPIDPTVVPRMEMDQILVLNWIWMPPFTIF